MTDRARLTSRITAHWAHYLGCAPEQLCDGGLHVVARPPVASSAGSPWPLRRGAVALMTTGTGWVLSVPEHLLQAARENCAAHSFAELVEAGDRLQQVCFDQYQATGERSSERGDSGYRVMDLVAGALAPRGWSHYLFSYCDSQAWTPALDPHVRPLTPTDAEIWRQWQEWPGPMVGPRVAQHFEIADAFGYVLDGKLVSAAQLEVNSQDFAWEYGADTLPAFRRRGFATAVLHTVTAHIIARGHLAWHYCDHYNRASKRLPGKLGYFRYAEGLFSAGGGAQT